MYSHTNHVDKNRMSSDDDVIEMHDVPTTRPKRLTFAEESTLPRLSTMCIDHTLDPDEMPWFIERQSSDTCLVHAIVNATQRRGALGDMLREIRHVNGLNRKDVAAGIECAKRIMGVVIRTHFDEDSTTIAIAHINMVDGGGHFIALKKQKDVWIVLDSLNGKMATLRNLQHFWSRCTPYSIVL